MIYIALEPQLDEWRDLVADLAHVFGATRTTVSYDEYTNIPDSIVVTGDVESVQFYVGDGTLNEWRTARYETETGFAEAKGWRE